MTNALTTGVHHVGLALPDIEAAKDFFCEALGFRLVGGVPSYPAHFVSDGTTLLTLWQVEDPATATGFDRRRNIGLHHLALGVADEAHLGVVHARIRDWPGVDVEFGPGPMREGSSVHHLIAAIPGGVRVEFAMPFV